MFRGFRLGLVCDARLALRFLLSIFFSAVPSRNATCKPFDNPPVLSFFMCKTRALKGSRGAMCPFAGTEDPQSDQVPGRRDGM